MSWPVMTTFATWPESAACMNSLKVMVFSTCWNFVEKFQMSTPRTTNAIQNNRLFNVEFTRRFPSCSAELLGLPKFQDYHGLRGVGYPKSLVDSEPGDPHNSIAVVDDQRDGVPPFPRHFPVYKVVLQLLLSVETDRPEPVAGATIADGEAAIAQIAANLRDVRPLHRAHNCTLARVRRHRPARVGQDDLSWNRQRKSKNGPRLGCRPAQRARRPSS